MAMGGTGRDRRLLVTMGAGRRVSLVVRGALRGRFFDGSLLLARGGILFAAGHFIQESDSVWSRGPWK